METKMKKVVLMVVLGIATMAQATVVIIYPFEDQSWPWTAYVYEGSGGAQANYPAPVGSLNGPSAPGSNVCVLQATAYYANIFMEGPLIPVNIPVGATFTVSYDVMFYPGYNPAGQGCYTWSTLGLIDANYQVVDHAGPGGFATPYTAITTSWQTPTSTHTNTTGTTIAYVRPRIFVQQGHSPSNTWANAWIDNYKLIIPEPASLAIFGLGLLGVRVMRKRA